MKSKLEIFGLGTDEKITRPTRPTSIYEIIYIIKINISGILPIASNVGL